MSKTQYKILNPELEQLYKRFKQLENDSLTYSITPKNKYLCIRLDAFKGSKRFLKNVLINTEFNEALIKAHKKLYYSFRNYFSKEYSSCIICTFIVNDEVSIILNSLLSVIEK